MIADHHRCLFCAGAWLHATSARSIWPSRLDWGARSGRWWCRLGFGVEMNACATVCFVLTGEEADQIIQSDRSQRLRYFREARGLAPTARSKFHAAAVALQGEQGLPRLAMVCATPCGSAGPIWRPRVRQAGEWSSCSNQLVVRCHRARISSSLAPSWALSMCFGPSRRSASSLTRACLRSAWTSASKTSGWAPADPLQCTGGGECQRQRKCF